MSATTRYVVRRPLLDLARRVHRSPMANDLRRGWARLQARHAAEDQQPLRSSTSAAFWPAVVLCAGLLLGTVLAIYTRGQYMTWDGSVDIPTGSLR